MKTKRRIIILCFVAFMFLFSGTFLYMSKIYEKDFVEENKVSDGANLKPISYYSWESIEYSTITLNSNGGTAKRSVIYNVSFKKLVRVHGDFFQLLIDIGREWFDTNDTRSLLNPFASPIPVPTRTDYKFLGYYTSSSGGTQTIDSSGKIIASVDNYKTNTTWYAHWEYYPTNFTLTFDRQGGTGGTSSIQVVLGQSVPAITPPTKTGYNFVGYFSGENGTGTQYYSSSGTALAPWGNQNSATLYAHWEGKSYTVVYHPGYSGVSSASHTGFKYGTSTALRTISALGYNRSGYKFLGWATSSGGGVAYSNGQNVNYLSSNGGEVHLYAVWQANTYTATLNPNGGNLPDSGYVATTDYSIVQSEIPAGIGASGWYQSGTNQWLSMCRYTYEFTFYEKVKVSLNAKERFDLEISVSLSTNGESADISGVAIYGVDGESIVWQGVGDDSATVTLTIPEGNHFFYFDHFVERETGSLADVYLAIPKMPNNTIKVTYDSSYGSLPAPTKTGYNFDGWFTAANGGSKVESGTLVKTAGNHTIYAHWSPKTFYVNFYANGGSGSMSSMSVTYDSGSKSLTSNAFKKENYIFKYWSTNSSGTGTKYYENQAVSNLTSALNLYAVWEESWNAHASQSLIGSGKINDPFLVSSAADLAYISKAVDNGTSFSGVYFKQAGNIDLGGKLWKPIGESSSKAFKGNYDGNGFLIKNLSTSSARVGSLSGNYLYSNVGLFGYTVGATLKNINLFSGTVYGNQNVGAIAGCVEAISAGGINTGSIEGCRSNVVVYGNSNCGMIGASNGCDITSCLNYGNILASENGGGIVGFNYGLKITISNSLARCNVSGTNSGGVIGRSQVSGTAVVACGFKGAFSSSSSGQGLIAGVMNGGKLLNCLAITTSNASLYASGTTAESCVRDNGSITYIGDDFSNWSELASGQFLPNGLAWIGGAGEGLKI